MSAIETYYRRIALEDTNRMKELQKSLFDHLLHLASSDCVEPEVEELIRRIYSKGRKYAKVR